MIDEYEGTKEKLIRTFRSIIVDLPPDVQKNNYPTFVPLNCAAIMGGFTHLGWLVLFLIIDVKVLFYFNIISVSMWSATVYLNRKGFHFSSFALAALEIILHQSLCVIIVGWAAGFQYWIISVLVALFMLPSGWILYKSIIVLCCYFDFILLDHFFRTSQPVVNIGSSLLKFLNNLNLVLFFASTVIILFYFASKMNETRQALRDEQNKVEHAYSLLSKYVAPQLSDTIVDGKIDLVWRHYRKKLTLFFSDIKEFTSITDSMEPEDMATLLNEYLTEMNAIINEYRGTLAQVIGDGLYVFFGAPESSNDRDHAVRCVNMAVDMQRKMRELNERWFDRGIDEVLQIRCGINTGMATVGGYGSSERKEYTAMGMQVNIAARIEQACRPGSVLISHTTWALVKEEISCSEQGHISVKGVRRPLRVYSVDVLTE